MNQFPFNDYTGGITKLALLCNKHKASLWYSTDDDGVLITIGDQTISIGWPSGESPGDEILHKLKGEKMHWYKKDGTPCYEITGKNKKLRTPTLREAKTMDLVPSVTSIIKESHKPGLENWIQEQGILAALTMPKKDGENDIDYLARIKRDSREQSKKAAERGTAIHGVLDDYFSGKSVPFELLGLCININEVIKTACGPVLWQTEKSFAFNGYGGKVDLSSQSYVLDFKTTEKDLGSVGLWDEHYMQLAAYRRGLKIPLASGAIVYVNILTQEAILLWAEEQGLVRGEKMFQALLDYWYAKSGLERK